MSTTGVNDLVTSQPNGPGHGPSDTSHQPIENQSPQNLEDYTCPVCMDPFIDPALTNCDHRFCTFCLANWFHLRGRKNCPTCRTAIHRLEALPTVAVTVEDLVERHFSPEQKSERAETKRMRNESQLWQGLGPNPLETIMARALESVSHFEFEFPNFELDEEDFVVESERIYVPSGFSQDSIINLYARAVFQSSAVDPEGSDWPSDLDHMMTSAATNRSNFTTTLNEIMARLDDFEISLRESQMAYRYLMDGLTSLDPGGLYFETIEQRFRSLGLFPEGGRMMSTFPSQDGSDSHTTPPSRSHMTPHPSDWYFLHHNRVRLERELRADWLHLHRTQAEASEREERRQVQAERDIQHLFRSESDNGTETESGGHFESYAAMFPEMRRPVRRRRRQRRSRNPFPDYPLPCTHTTPQGNAFPTFDRSIYSTPQMYADQPYDHYEETSVRFHAPTRLAPENSVTTTAQNICVVHPDGSETWVDVAQRLERDDGYSVFMSRPAAESANGQNELSSQRALFLTETEEEDESPEESRREESYEVEFVVHRPRCTQCSNGGHHCGCGP